MRRWWRSEEFASGTVLWQKLEWRRRCGEEDVRGKEPRSPRTGYLKA
jgi:hypothetical protein